MHLPPLITLGNRISHVSAWCCTIWMSSLWACPAAQSTSAPQLSLNCSPHPSNTKNQLAEKHYIIWPVVLCKCEWEQTSPTLLWKNSLWLPSLCTKQIIELKLNFEDFSMRIKSLKEELFDPHSSGWVDVWSASAFYLHVTRYAWKISFSKLL